MTAITRPATLITAAALVCAFSMGHTYTYTPADGTTAMVLASSALDQLVLA